MRVLLRYTILSFIICWFAFLILTVQLITGRSMSPLPQFLALIVSLISLYIMVARKSEIKEFKQLYKKSIKVKIFYIVTVITSFLLLVLYIIKFFLS